MLENPDKLLDSPLYSLVKQGEFDVTSTVTKPGAGNSHMEWTVMLVVSLREVNFGFWSRLVCSGQNVIIFSR